MLEYEQIAKNSHEERLAQRCYPLVEVLKKEQDCRKGGVLTTGLEQAMENNNWLPTASKSEHS